MAYAQWKRDIVAPAAGDGVDIGGANTTCIDGDVNIVVFKFFQWKLPFMSAGSAYQSSQTYFLSLERAPISIFDVSNSERVSGVRVRHFVDFQWNESIPKYRSKGIDIGKKDGYCRMQWGQAALILHVIAFSFPVEVATNPNSEVMADKGRDQSPPLHFVRR